jgi:uncharacterized delta-60 repeat protein
MRLIPLASLICGLLGSLAQPCSAATNVLDSAFGSMGAVPLRTPISFVNLHVSAVRAVAGGMIIVAGYVDGGANVQAAVGRLNEDGSWDASFADHGLFLLPNALLTISSGDDYLHSVVALSDGSVVASGGRSNFFNFYPCTILLKLDSRGVLDSGFGPDHNGAFCFDFPAVGATGVLHPDHLALDTDDTIYLTTAGSTGSAISSGIARFDGGGNLSSTYGNNGLLMFPSDTFMYLPQLLPTHDLIVTGTRSIAGAQDYSMNIVNLHLTSAGQIDHGYGTDGIYTFSKVTTQPVTPIFSALDSQGRQLVTDYDVFRLRPMGIARTLTGGSTDPAFNAKSAARNRELRRPSFIG